MPETDPLAQQIKAYYEALGHPVTTVLQFPGQVAEDAIKYYMDKNLVFTTTPYGRAAWSCTSGTVYFINPETQG